MQSTEAINRARQRHREGKFAEAEHIYRQVLKEHPRHSEAMHLLGALLGQRGDVAGAIDLVRQSIAIHPEDAEAHRNLGVFLARQRRLEEARESFSRAVRLRPTDAAAHLNLAKVLTALAQPAEALEAYHRVAALSPGSAEVYQEIGNLLGRQGRHEEAVVAYARAIQLQPDLPMAHFGLGHVFRTVGQFDEALAEYREAARIKPDLIEAHASMAIIFARLQRFDEAIACHRRVVEINPDAAVADEVLGWIKLRRNDGAAAIDHFRRAVAADPKLLSAWNSLGLALQYLGRFEEAAECFKRIIAIRPDIAVAHKHLVNSNRQNSESQIEPLLNLLQQPALSLEERISAEFALATALDDSARFEEAFAHAAMANALAKQQRAGLGECYDADAFRKRVDQIIETFTPQFFESHQNWGDPTELPVFVVGMPRSGTTLAQQIAASHPQVHGAGELNAIFKITENLAELDAHRWTREAVISAAKGHIDFLRQMGGEASRIVDKMPSNLHHLGLIAVLFPRARVVFCRRDPRDTCVSCFFQSFTAGNIFSYDLADCGHYHRQNDRLMAHWIDVLPLRKLEFRYEHVVNDLEGQSRRLIEFLSLPWDPACLEFYRTQTTVQTSSVWQVRQPIYKGSVGRWRHYESHLDPLIKALSQ